MRFARDDTRQRADRTESLTRQTGQVAARGMRSLHEVARNARAGHFVWSGGREVDKSDVD